MARRIVYIRHDIAPTRERRGLQRFRLTGVRDIGTEIGRGSYAAVVELEFHGLKCAGKKLYRHIYDDVLPREQEGMLQRFETECEIMSELKHPNVVQFMGVHFGTGSELPTLVMEFLHTTLSACVDRYGRLPEEISYNILDDVATALCYLHGQDPPVIHRDLTANNVLLTADMRAKVSDLGVAKILNLTPAQRTQMTTCPGTPAYMPPEAIAHNPTYDTSIDCFSCGVLMLHVSCGRWPIPGEPNRVDPSNPTRLIPLSEADRREQYLQDIDPNHPLRPLINQCLSNHPPARPNAEEILRRVRGVLAQHPPPCEDKVALLNQHREEKEALQEEARRLQGQARILQDEVQQLSSQVSRYRQDIEEVVHAHSIETERMRIQLTESSTQSEALALRLGSKNEELEAFFETVSSKEREIAAKDRIIAAIRGESATKDTALQAKDEAVRALLRQSERIQEHISSTSQVLISSHS